MLWLGTSPNEPQVRALLDSHQMGLLAQPWGTSTVRSGWIWAADNGCYSTTKWAEKRWLSWLSAQHPRSGCLFATVPDVVGDHSSTLIYWRKYSGIVRDLRYPVAFVAQDGADRNNIPWDEIDVLFIGGTTSFKQGFGSGLLALRAKELGKWVHVGRVNSFKRLAYWADVADSADGTFLAFGPQKNAPRVQAWVEALRQGTQLSMTGETYGNAL